MGDDTSASLRTLAKGAGILGLSTFASKVIMYFYRILVARQDIGIGPEQYGVLSLGIAVFWMAMTFANLGISKGVIRRISDYRGRGEEDRVPDVFAAAVSVTVPVSLLVGGAVFLLAEKISLLVFHDAALTPVLKVFAVAIPFQALYNHGSSVVQAYERLEYMAYVDKLFRSAATLGFTLLLLWLGWGVMGAVAAQLAAIALSTALIFWFAHANVFPVLRRWGDAASERGWLISYSWPLFLSGVVGLAVGWTDTVFLGFFDASKKVGLYNAALPTAQVMNVVGTAMSSALFPAVSQFYGAGKKEEAVSITGVALKWTHMMAFPAALMMALFAGPILRLLFGSVYVPAATALSFLAAAYFIQTMMDYAGTFVHSEERTKLALFNSLAVASLNVVLNLVLIPMYSATGAAIATTISLTFGSFLVAGEAYYLFGVQPFEWKRFVPGTLATVVAAGAVYGGLKLWFGLIPKWTVIPAFAVFGILYLFLYIAFGGLGEEDIEILRTVDEKTDTNLEPVKKWVRKLMDIRG